MKKPFLSKEQELRLLSAPASSSSSDSNKTYLTDSDGNAINSLDDYKIMFADGTELGWAHTGITTRQLATCGPVPSSSGAIFQWSTGVSVQSDSDTWVEGDVGYLIGAMGNKDGTWLGRVLYMDTNSLNSSAAATPPVLAWATDGSFAQGFYGHQTTGNRIALFAYDSQGNPKGMRPYPLVRPSDGQLDVLGVDKSLGLDCQFVKVKRLPNWISGNEGDNQNT